MRIHFIFTLLFVIAIAVFGHQVSAQDTDGDGPLDLLDVRGLEPNANGSLDFNSRGIEDLDGANLLTNLEILNLCRNQTASIESGDIAGLTNLHWL